MFSLSKVYMRIGISSATLLLLGLSIWSLSLPLDMEALSSFQIGIQFPDPVNVGLWIIVETVFLYWLWRVQGKKNL